MHDPKNENQEPLWITLMYVPAFALIIVGFSLSMLDLSEMLSWGLMALGAVMAFLSRILSLLRIIKQGKREELHEGKAVVAVGASAVAAVAAVICGVSLAGAYSCGFLVGFFVESFLVYLLQWMETGSFPVGKCIFKLIWCAAGSVICLLLANRVKAWLVLIVCGAFWISMVLLEKWLFSKKTK